MSPLPDEERSPEETLAADPPISPHALRHGSPPAPALAAEDAAGRPLRVSTAARADSSIDPQLTRRAKSWLSRPDEPRESALQEGARAAGAKVRTGAAAVVDHAWVWARRTLDDLREDLRHRDRWFAWKAGIVAGWVVLSLVCLGVASSGGPVSPARNRIDAYVVVRPSALGWALLVENRSGRPWTKVEVQVDGFVFRQDLVLPEDRLVLGPAQFAADGTSPSAERAPDLVRIVASEGTVELPLGP